MHLKKLDVTGFKSFADATHLDFEPGITAVVGPNGCGKSNIIDAIRWCLGEMSAKSLRSNLMLDVVFNGSGSRPPQNMAEVTLTFDNSDKRLPIDYGEVSITRRLFRSGESEYFINKTQCRLRDIKDLFLDTGMGEDGYSSMEQGKVEWILQAKPEERRELFEEAAGVSKYRARREEALRKLERVDVDLSRLADIIAVTQDQIRKLENAVTKAKTYERLRDELKTMEIGDWLHQFSESDRELSELSGRLTEKQRNAESLNTALHQANAEIATHRLALTQIEEELLQANGVLAGIDADLRIGEERLAQAKRRQGELERQIESLHGQVNSEKNRIKDLLEQKARQSETIDKLREEGVVVEKDCAEAQGIHDAALAHLESKKKSVKEARDSILDRSQERSRLQQQLAQLTSDASRFQSRAEHLQKEQARTAQEFAELAGTLTQQEEQIGGLKQQLSFKSNVGEEIFRKSAQLTEQEANYRERILNTMEEVAKLSGRIRSIHDHQSSDPYLAGAHAVIAANVGGIQGPLGRLLDCHEGSRDLVTATLGEHLSDLVAETLEDAQRAVEFLRNEGKGRARIWVLNRLPNVPPAESLTNQTDDRVLNRVQTDERYRTLIEHLCSGLFIQDSTVYGTAIVHGGVDPSKWQSHIEHRLPELEQELEKKSHEKVQFEGELVGLMKEQEDLALTRDANLKEIEEVRVRLEILEKDQSKLQMKKDLYLQEQGLSEQDLAKLQDDQAKSQALLEACLARVHELQNRETDDHNQLDLLQQELTEHQSAYAHANANLSTVQESLTAYQEKMDWQTSVLNQITRDLMALETDLVAHQESILEMDAELTRAKDAERAAHELIQGSLARRQESAQSCADLQARRAALIEQNQQQEAQLTKLRRDLDLVHESIQKELIQQTAIHGRTENLVQKLLDQYELTIEAAKQQFEPQLANPETLDRLKKRVHGMGPINLAAPQEHAELAEKSTFLLNQQADLHKAKDDLRQVITKINATTREHFRETFEQVRENFRSLYSRLFQGGEADLRCTDETDILSTGIDMYCQPPGKKLLHISLLSGGEKALTAIALLFAFFQVRPSPVALLDEVDAPLDEANILRFVDMIKLFSEKSQFIFISHNKRTMEAAHNLYGVTMEELGVSKVLSARLQKEKEAPVAKEPATAP